MIASLKIGQVKEGDQIISVNQVSTAAAAMIERCKSDAVLELVVVRALAKGDTPIP